MAQEFSFIAVARPDYTFVITANSLAHIRRWNTGLNFDGILPGILCGITMPDPIFTNRNIRRMDTRQICGACIVKAVLVEVGEVKDA